MTLIGKWKLFYSDTEYSARFFEVDFKKIIFGVQIYLMMTQFLRDQVLVVQTFYSAIHRINHYLVEKYYAIRWIVIYSVDSAIQRLNNQAKVWKRVSKMTFLVGFFFSDLSNFYFVKNEHLPRGL